MKYSEKLFYEDDKCIITKDKWQYIVRPKPINPKNPYNKATYITNKHFLLKELCLYRKFFSETSDQAQTILKLLRRNGGAM